MPAACSPLEGDCRPSRADMTEPGPQGPGFYCGVIFAQNIFYRIPAQDGAERPTRDAQWIIVHFTMAGWLPGFYAFADYRDLSVFFHERARHGYDLAAQVCGF